MKTTTLKPGDRVKCGQSPYVLKFVMRHESWAGTPASNQFDVEGSTDIGPILLTDTAVKRHCQPWGIRRVQSP